jgi:hypothetical protein
VNTSDDEVGVKFGAASRRDEPTTWFRPAELEAGSSLHAHACAPIAPGDWVSCGQRKGTARRSWRAPALVPPGRKLLGPLRHVSLPGATATVSRVVE